MPPATPVTIGGLIQWVGYHSPLAFSRVLKRVAREQRSGELQVRNGKAVKTVYFKGGQVVFAASNVKTDRLGETMMESGRISPQQFLLASNLMWREGRKFGEALLRIGVITKGELDEHIRSQFHRIVRSLFNFREGLYSFEERTLPIPERLLVNLPVSRLLLEGLRGLDDESFLVACLPPPSCRLRPAGGMPPGVDVRTLSSLERAVLDAVGEGATARSIVRRVGSDCHRVLYTCCALLASGILEPESEAVPPADLRQKVRSEFDRTDHMSETELLQVSEDAGPDDIRKAYAIRRVEWAQIKSWVENERSAELKASEIQFRLAAACHRLLTGNPTSPTQSESTPVPAACSDELVPGTFSPQGSPLPEPSGPAGPDADRLESHPGQASASMNDGQRAEKAQRLYRDIRLHFQVKDWEGVIPLLIELVELEPQNPEYRGLLARAMFKNPKTRRNAERHFLEAIRLAPGDPNLHVWLGLYYKTFGLSSRAAAEFRVALALDPHNQGARKHLMS